MRWRVRSWKRSVSWWNPFRVYWPGICIKGKAMGKPGRNIWLGMFGLLLVLSGCGGMAGKASLPEWQEQKGAVAYQVWQPGWPLEAHQRGRDADRKNHGSVRYEVVRFKLKGAKEIYGRKAPVGTLLYGLATGYGSEKRYLLEPHYEKIVPVSPGIAYARPYGSSTFLRIDLASGQETPTPYTQAGAVARRNVFLRNRSPFYLAP